VTNIILSIWFQNSRFKAQKKLLQPNLFGFKIQDSRLRKNFFNPTSLDSRFKIHDSRLRKNFFNPTCLDSRFKAEGFRIQFFWGILNLESYPLGFKKFFLSLES